MNTDANPMAPRRIFFLVTIGALCGLALGALFGLCAGKLTPTFFAHFIPWSDVEPVGFAVMLGAFGGLFLGGGLAVFSLLLHLLLRLSARSSSSQAPPQ